MSIDFLSLLELFSRVLPVVSNVTVAVLHSTGADKHKTIAGDIAQNLQMAGQTATALHAFLLNSGSPHQDSAETPGGGA